MQYKLNTKYTWTQVYSQIRETFKKWGVVSYDISEPRGARLTSRWQSEQDRTVRVYFKVNGKDVELTMGLQDRAVDNLRVLAMTVEDLRMNEVRGIDKSMGSAYLQLQAPVQIKNPYDILGLPRGTALSVCEAQYREKAKSLHPDAGGYDQAMMDLNSAIKQIREEING